MRIAMPLCEGKFSVHYGRAEKISIHDIDLEGGTSVDVGVKDFPEGTCGAGAWVARQGVEVMLVGGLGAGAAQGLEEAGVKVLAGVQEEDAAKVLRMFLEGATQVRELAPGESACQGHDHEHEHGEGHVCTCRN
jgi:predicted Fe-Mo cluster-binding NifX family protein